MGGASDLNVPKGIWSPAGGFYADPKKWKRNTVLAVAAMVAICLPVFFKSVELEQRHRMPNRWIPSMMWTPEKKLHQED